MIIFVHQVASDIEIEIVLIPIMVLRRVRKYLCLKYFFSAEQHPIVILLVDAYHPSANKLEHHG